MSILVKVFSVTLVSILLFFSYFVNYVINTERENSLIRLNNKIKYNKEIQSVIIFQLLYNFN